MSELADKVLSDIAKKENQLDEIKRNMGKDKSLQKIVQPKSLEKIIEYNVLVKRGLRALGIETPEDKFEKELYKLINEFSNLIFFKKLRNEQFIKFGKADARTYLNKLNKLADKIIAVCQKTLKNIGSNSPLKFPTSFMMGFLLMSKNRNQDATVFLASASNNTIKCFIYYYGREKLS